MSTSDLIEGQINVTQLCYADCDADRKKNVLRNLCIMCIFSKCGFGNLDTVYSDNKHERMLSSHIVC